MIAAAAREEAVEGPGDRRIAAAPEDDAEEV
jgi:hypothetical protein